ncbi:MAG: hypothetical protein ABWY56_15245 [Propionibacteriaceae bacterium]
MESASQDESVVEPVGQGELAELVDRVPEGWTAVGYAGRRYGLSRSDRAGGQSVAIYAEELGGSDVVSTNVYRPSSGDVLRPCEMPAEKVLDFLRGWTATGSDDVAADVHPPNA